MDKDSSTHFKKKVNISISIISFLYNPTWFTKPSSSTAGLRDLAEWLRKHSEVLRQLVNQLGASGEVKAQLGRAAPEGKFMGMRPVVPLGGGKVPQLFFFPPVVGNPWNGDEGWDPIHTHYIFGVYGGWWLRGPHPKGFHHHFPPLSHGLRGGDAAMPDGQMGCFTLLKTNSSPRRFRTWKWNSFAGSNCQISRE